MCQLLVLGTNIAQRYICQTPAYITFVISFTLWPDFLMQNVCQTSRQAQIFSMMEYVSLLVLHKYFW